MAPAPIFQVSFPGATDQESASLVPLGLWQPAPVLASFAADHSQPGIIWRADLPAEDEGSALALYQNDLALHQADLALAAAGPLLEADLRLAAVTGKPGTTYGLSAGPAAALSGRQAILAQALNPGLASTPQGISFDLKDVGAALEETIQHFTGQVGRLVDQAALVESSRGGLPTGSTQVEWLGDVHTWWRRGRDEKAIAEHKRVLAQALATRQAWLRMVLVFTAGVAKVSLAMAAAGPFNPIAVWTAWTYLQKVIEQYRSLNATH